MSTWRIRLLAALIFPSALFAACGSNTPTPVDLSISATYYLGEASSEYLLTQLSSDFEDDQNKIDRLNVGIFIDIKGNWVGQGLLCDNPDPIQESWSLPLIFDKETGVLHASGPMPQHKEKPLGGHAPSSCTTARDGIHIDEIVGLQLVFTYPDVSPELCDAFANQRCAGAASEEDCHQENKVWACQSRSSDFRAALPIRGAELKKINKEVQDSGTLTLNLDVILEPSDPNENPSWDLEVQRP